MAKQIIELDSTFIDDKWDLLWENEDPTLSFEPKTIEINMSKYSKIKVLFYPITNDVLSYPDKCVEVICNIGTIGFVLGSRGTAGLNNEWNTIRYFYSTKYDIYFSKSTHLRNETSGTINGQNIPYRIYAQI